ncbi:SMEK domain-containing protein [Massilia sp. TWR1-2-2]|uniref:SMEK domain-containing protein n=1 Tax=Massilia sp. TWR1-2-2 TaxID=2804584 RepID=UPI003CF9321A
MPVASTAEFESILMNLSVLRYIFKSKSKRGQYDLNKAAESFFRDFLNIAFDYSLINLNDITENHAAIDLGDSLAKLCFQVTAENGSGKIKSSLKKFEEKGLGAKYSRLVMLLLTEKKNYSTKFLPVRLVFDPQTDIWDIDDLLAKIEKLSLEKKAALAKLLTDEMRPLFALFAGPESIFRVQPVANMPALTARKLLDHLNYDMASGDAIRIFKKVDELYSKLSNLSHQARSCLYVLLDRGEFKQGYFQLSPQEFENLLKAIPEHERRGNFQSLQEAGLADFDDGMLTASWKVEPYADFFEIARHLVGKDSDLGGVFKRLVVEADFSVLD